MQGKNKIVTPLHFDYDGMKIQCRVQSSWCYLVLLYDNSRYFLDISARFEKNALLLQIHGARFQQNFTVYAPQLGIYTVVTQNGLHRLPCISTRTPGYYKIDVLSDGRLIRKLFVQIL